MRSFLVLFMFFSVGDVGALSLRRETGTTVTETIRTGTTTEVTTTEATTNATTTEATTNATTTNTTTGTISSAEETADQEVAWVMSHNAIIGIVIMSFIVLTLLFCFCLEFGFCAI